MPLSSYQMSYRGVTIGDSTNYDVIELEGLHDMAVRDRDRDNPRSQGMIPGFHSATSRLIRCTLEVRGTPGATAHETDIQNLLSAMSPDAHELPNETDDQFTFKFPGEDEKYIFARPVRRSRPRRNNTEFGLARVSFELKVYDPRAYSTTEDNSGSQTTATSPFNVTNGGDAYAYPIIEFDPNANGDAKITNNTNLDTIEINGAGAGAGLICDMGRFIRGRGDLLIIYRATNLYGNWVSPRNAFRLSPGVNSLTLNVGDSVIIKSRDTWM